MCGRFALKSPPAKLMEYFGLDTVQLYEPRYNIAPSTQILAIRQRDGGRHGDLLKWGLIPGWAKDAAIGNRLANARGETVAEKPSFKNAYQRRRCIVPADGFYEWQATPSGKQPYYISLKSGDPIALAGLWEFWISPEGEKVYTCCLITTEPNGLMKTIHDRMPVIIPQEKWREWLDAEPRRPNLLLPLITPYPAENMQAWPVSKAVNRAGIEGEELISQCRN